MRRTYIIVLILMATTARPQSTSGLPDKPGPGRIASFMTAGANSASFRHFILMPGGSLDIFAPGEQPHPFPGIDNVVDISAGRFHMLALKKDGTVWAWGWGADMVSAGIYHQTWTPVAIFTQPNEQAR